MYHYHKLQKISKVTGLLVAVLLPLLVMGVLQNVSAASETISPQSAASDAESIFIEDLTRSVNVNKYGILRVSDELLITNNQSTSVSTLQWCLTDDEYENIIFYEALLEGSPQGMHLLSDKVNGYYQLQIVLSQPFIAYSSISLTLNLMFEESYDYSDSGAYTYHSTLFPITPYEIKSATSMITLPSDATGATFAPDGESSETTDLYRSYSETDYSAYSETDVTFTFSSSSTQLIVMNSIDRVIKIHPMGYLEVIEKSFLQSLSVNLVSEFKFQVPIDATNITASDYLGLISGISSIESTNDEKLNVTFSLSTNRASLRQGNIFTYTLNYYLPYDSYISKDLTTNNLQIDLFTTKTEFVVKETSIEIELLGATKIDRINIQNFETEKSTHGLTLSMNKENIVSQHLQILDISFNTNAFSLLSDGFLYSIIIIFVLSAYVVLSSKRSQGREDENVDEEDTIQLAEIRQFVNLYEEKNALMVDIEKADQDLIRKKINKKNYNKLVKDYLGKIKDIDNEIRPFKTSLIEAGGKVAATIQKLDYLEAEKISVKDSVRLLEDRYKRGKLPSKAAYERLSEDLIKRMEATSRKVDRNINELRAFLI